MNNTHRYMPDWPLPPYIFIPGENPHPKKEGGHMQGGPDPVATPIPLDAPEQSEFLRYSLDLYNYGYYWESHVYFEALWNAHQRQGLTADFLKALIKLAAGQLKLRLKQQSAAQGHGERARELLLAIQEQTGEMYLGFNLKKLAIESGVLPSQLKPVWD